MSAIFTRKASNRLIDKLRKKLLFKLRLKDDCVEENLFLAIRNENIDFYHKGGRLFEYGLKDGFKTHIKYAAVIDPSHDDYLTQKALSGIKIKPNFIDHYERIKENCSKYSGVEAVGVSDIYHGNSYLNKNIDVVVLDIETVFESFSKKKRTDRVDIVVYDKNQRNLVFMEAKHYSNPEIWASKGMAEVVSQVSRYKTQVKNRKPEILKAYTDYINSVNRIFNCKLPVPLEIDDEVILLVFGFDRRQRSKLTDARFKATMPGVKRYIIGNQDKIDLAKMLKNAKVM